MYYIDIFKNIIYKNSQYWSVLKVQLETLTNQLDQSYSLMFNPRLSDLFFWHFHPEYELVFIDGPCGTRHVGDHVSKYHGSDMVLMGSNIPHLNFDYGVKSEYSKIVVHLKTAFVDQHIKSIPELVSIYKLFERSSRGIAFRGQIKSVVGPQLFQLRELDRFEQYQRLLYILHILSQSTEYEFLHDAPYAYHHRSKEQARMQLIYAFVDRNYDRKIDLQEVADLTCMTKESFCRYFKKTTTYTFTEFLNRYRVSHSKRDILAGKSISDACYGSGFESLSYYNRIFKNITGENPRDFRKRHVVMSTM